MLMATLLCDDRTTATAGRTALAKFSQGDALHVRCRCPCPWQHVPQLATAPTAAPASPVTRTCTRWRCWHSDSRPSPHTASHQQHRVVDYVCLPTALPHTPAGVPGPAAARPGPRDHPTAAGGAAGGGPGRAAGGGGAAAAQAQAQGRGRAAAAAAADGLGGRGRQLLLPWAGAWGR